MPPKTEDPKDQPRPRGRPVEKDMPPAIPDTLENIAKAVLSTPPKKESEWKYLKKTKG